MSKHLIFATALLFVVDLVTCASVHAEKTETFDSAASAAANGWTAINDGVDLQSAGVIDENTAGGAAAGEAQYHVYRGMGLAFVDTNIGVTVNGQAAFSMTGVLSNLGGVRPDPDTAPEQVISGDVGFPPLLGFSSGPADQIGIMFRGDDPGGVGETGSEVAWGLRFVRALNEPVGNIIFGAGGDFSRILQEGVSYPFSLVYNPDDGEFGSVTASVTGAGEPIPWFLTENERNHLNEVAFNSAGIRKFDNGHNPYSNFDLRFDDLTYTGEQAPPAVAGDLNGDGLINFGDLTPFATALTDPEAYATMFPGLDRVARCDVSGDSLCNFGDLTPFVDLLTGGPGTAAVPEPSFAYLMFAGIMTALMGCRRGS